MQLLCMNTIWFLNSFFTVGTILMELWRKIFASEFLSKKWIKLSAPSQNMKYHSFWTPTYSQKKVILIRYFNTRGLYVTQNPKVSSCRYNPISYYVSFDRYTCGIYILHTYLLFVEKIFLTSNVGQVSLLKRLKCQGL